MSVRLSKDEMDSAWSLHIRSGEERDFSRGFADLLLRYTPGQRPQAGLAHLEWVEKTSSCLLLLGKCQLSKR